MSAATLPMEEVAVQVHWLESVVRNLGLFSGEGLRLEARLPIQEAWSRAARVCGVSEDELARRVAGYFRLRVADLGAAEARVLRLVPEKLAWKFGVFPLREDDRHLVVATSEPLNMDAEQVLGFASGRATVFEVAPPQAIQQAIARSYSPDAAIQSLLHGVDAEAGDAVRFLERRGPERLTASQIEAAPIVKLTNHLLQQAVAARASDVHVEPGERGGTVRFRVDGVLRHYMQLPPEVFNRVVSRIKILGKLDIADRLRPHDGRTGIQIGDREFDLRISTVPTRDSEKAVIRLLDPNGAGRLEDIGLPERERQRFRQLIAHREGIVIVTGPTGSGKTTTLYAAIRELATGEVNITTVEDPIEYKLPQITQIQVDPARSVTFASALRAILRQDPDVIFVGEIRDRETAEMAVQASQTGHLVLATLHTNDAVGVVSRLADLGLERGRIAETLRGVVSQRLVRRVCPHCAEPVSGELGTEERELAARYGVQPAVRALGCPRCAQTGFFGRVPILEVLTLEPRVEELIARGATQAEIQRAAVQAGMVRIDQVARDRVRAGETTLPEIHRVLGEADAPADAAHPHVLVVDDDADNRLLARVVLENDGFRVTEADDGDAALDRLRAGERFDLVILDLDMPRVNGRAVLSQLRRAVATATLPVIVLTGTVGPSAEIQVMEEGADDYIRKPLDAPRFLARVKGVLRRAAAW